MKHINNDDNNYLFNFPSDKDQTKDMNKSCIKLKTRLNPIESQTKKDVVLSLVVFVVIVVF